MKQNVGRLDLWGKIGLFIHRFRITFILLATIVAGSLAFFAPKLPGILGGDGFKTKGDYQTTRKILEKDFKQSQDTLFLVFQKRSGTEEAFRTQVQRVVEKIANTEDFASFRHPGIDPTMQKADIAYATILLKGADTEALTKNTLAFAERVRKESNELVQIVPTGFAVINDEINARSQSDLKKAEMIGLPIAFLVLLLSFGRFTASLLPIINGILSVVAAMGILYFVGREMELSIFVLNVAPMIGFALSIDFALLFVNRFREEIETKSVGAAIGITYQTAGRSIVFSGLCVFVGLAGLFFFQIDYIQSVAISGTIVVIMSIFFSLTVLPAVLSLMGKRLLRKGKWSESRSASFWRSFATFVMSRPVLMVVTVLAFIFVSLLPLRNANFQFPGVESLPERSEARIAYERYENEFNEMIKTHADVTIVVETDGSVTELKNLQIVEKLIQKLKQDKQVYRVTGIDAPSAQLDAARETPQVQALFGAYTNGNKTFIQIALKNKPKSAEAKDWVRDFKKRYEQDGLTYYVGGLTKFEQELEDEIINKIAVAMTLILGSTFVILMIAFRSLLIPLKAIIMNILSLSATIGIVVWLFEGGHLGLEQSAVMFVLPVFIFGLVFGLSMDYEVFLISRMYELYHETGDNDYATLEGLVSTSRIITSAALIMIVVTGAFAFTDILPVQQMGIGVALAIFLDATIVRLLLVPSLMKLFGHWNWWFFDTSRKQEKSGA
ncbi:MMPL family transporter [Ectobacillus antri]|jgi:uncharacterized membrane protein YdfJ with MMPL/SSD domain|uniref:MMPL family transporter n=1 Tax=Ectobacillus antri TaxID=2486280 RepID=A0ABT6H5X1_9BACI|nr:MMPL family transporter [Ectobacillus antri]MDG4657488.1 MMPL family transporter [Ectobacillus antri]MDG5753801.1 MMPL family transporter [Ectobacillus antri]